MVRSAALPGRLHRLDASNEHSARCDENGLTLGPVPLLARTMFGFMPRPAAEIDFVLSETFGVPLRKAAQMVPALEAIAGALDRGDLALAMIATLHLGLPVLDDAQAMRARRAEKVLKAGFNPDEPRDAQGRWTSEGGGSSTQRQLIEGRDVAAPGPASDYGPGNTPSGGARHIPFVQNVQDRVTPHGFSVDHLPGKNPLDPMGLNKPVLSAEMERIANALTLIESGNTKALVPHPYQNLPAYATGAQLPASATGYKAYIVPDLGQGRGYGRLIVENGTGATYYTNNHYDSFYAVNLSP